VYKGAFGVDSQDILSAPDIDFGTFQLFPDSINYGTEGPATDVTPPSCNFGKTLNETVAYIKAQVSSASVWVLFLLTAEASDLRSAFHSIGKPVVISAVGIVTSDNLPFFVPVDKTSPVVKHPPKKKDRKRESWLHYST